MEHEKKESLLGYLERGVAMVHLDARRAGVIVPAQFEKAAHLRLNLSYRFDGSNIDIDEGGVRATLSFNRQPFRCILPWSSIYGITHQESGAGNLWPEDLPAEVTLATAGRETETAARPSLQVIPGGASLPVSVEDDATNDPEPKCTPPRGHLRLVRN
jgi:stringent starvation protein B